MHILIVMTVLGEGEYQFCKLKFLVLGQDLVHYIHSCLAYSSVILLTEEKQNKTRTFDRTATADFYPLKKKVYGKIQKKRVPDFQSFISNKAFSFQRFSSFK